MSTQSNANAAGEGAGNAVKGVFQAIHGAGEAIRGNINSALDGAGDAVAGREQGSVTSRTDGKQGSVAQAGIDEIKQGIRNVQGQGNGEGTVGTAHNPAGPAPASEEKRL